MGERREKRPKVLFLTILRKEERIKGRFCFISGKRRGGQNCQNCSFLLFSEKLLFSSLSEKDWMGRV